MTQTWTNLLGLKHWEPEHPYILAEQYISEGIFFPYCLKVSSVVLVFKNVVEMPTAKNYSSVCLLPVVGKISEKYNKLVHLLEEWDLFFFQFYFRSSCWTADLLKVVYDRIVRAVNSTGATQAVALDISKAFEKILHATLFHKLVSRFHKLVEFQVRYLVLFYLFLVIDDIAWF